MSEAQTFKGKYKWADLEFLEFLRGGGGSSQTRISCVGGVGRGMDIFL